MIQRIQTIYLLLAGSVLGAQFGLPYAIAPSSEATAANAVFADGKFNLFDNIGLLGLTGLGILMALGAIFLYKNRTLQARISGLGVLVSVLLLVLVAFVFYTTTKSLPLGTHISYHLGQLMPLLAAVFLFLAQRAIGKDERLVRSMDRLR